MADLSDNRWNEQANLNTSPTPDGLPNGTNPSALYGLMREERAAYKRSWKRMNSIVTSTGAANAYVLVYDVAPTDNVNGEWFSFFAHADNTGAATIKINNLTTKNLLDSNGIALVAGAIKAGCSYTVEYKDTAYRLRGLSINNPVFKGTASFENGAFTGTLSQDGQRVLTVADYGTGKGLDADKLDGQEGTYYLARANGTGTQPISTVAGLQAAIDAVNEAIALATPTGSVTAWTTETAPPGYLLCNGAAVSRTTYAKLFSVIGGIFGGGDGNTTFNVPDLRGVFVRGKDSGRGLDPNRALGSYQDSDNKSHSHGVNDPGHYHSGVQNGRSSTGRSTSVDQPPAVFSLGNTDWAATGIWLSASGGNESRPRNVALNYIIKT